MRNTLTLLLDRHVDVAFCTSFWSLQRHFQQPDKVVETESSWNHLVDIIEQVLRAFENSTTNTSDSITDCSDYYPKFLTSPYLLNLELKDAFFRRHVLLQLLIFFQALSLRISSQANVPGLSESQRKALQKLKDRVRHQLEKTTPQGVEFTNAVFSILQREKNWIMWKREGCKSFERKAISRSETLDKTKGALKLPSDLAKIRKKSHETLKIRTLLRQWAAQQHVDHLADSTKSPAPSLTEFLTPMLEQMNPDAGIEEEYKLKNDKLYVWRAMRLLAKHKLPYLNMMQTESIETVVSHLMKDETKQQLQVKDVQDTVTEPKQPQKAHLEAEVENGK